MSIIKNSLAIIIPAYKALFFSKTLETLAQQTCKDFTVYVGNDGGDAGIEEIVNRFRPILNIHYRYFENNFGSKSLVKHWERCFTLTQGEKWYWLLPDDDYADPQCVELFYDQLQKSDFDLFRFNVHFVTGDEKIFKTNPTLPDVQSSFDGLMEKLSFSRPSTVAEFIFNRKKFGSIGFKEIPMAWGTDDLLWYEIGAAKGIRGCNDAYVYLRQSDLNISNNYSTLATQKIDANFIFFKKLFSLLHFAPVLNSKIEFKKFIKIAINHIMYNLQDYNKILSLKEVIKYAVWGNRIWSGGVLKNIRRFYKNNKLIINKRKLNIGE